MPVHAAVKAAGYGTYASTSITYRAGVFSPAVCLLCLKFILSADMQTVVKNSRGLPLPGCIPDMSIPVFMRLLTYSAKVSACFFLQDEPFGFHENLHSPNCIFMKNLALKKAGLIGVIIRNN